ncbi:LytR C-terminal domain-containing protein, partial [Candidatus Microgenomates bacterium]|nr:LytR C-terminal domain-containing protein [Candidatus Microgenomates bacterium]
KEQIINWEAIFKSSSGVGKFHSNLTFPNLLSVYLRFKKITGGKLQFVDLYSTNLLIEDRQADGSLVLTAQPEVLDNELHNLFNEEGIIKERLKSEILNSTDEPGLAEKAARIVTNLGVQVINTGNFNSPISYCLIYTAKEDVSSYTVSRLATIFHCQIKETVLPESRADLSIMVGKEYLKMLTTPRRRP